MRLAAGVVGTPAGPIAHEVDARWLMAYAAALGETDARYFDTRGALLAHPLFPVCYEWPAAVAVRERAIPDDIYARVVHATHRLVVHRAPRAGETLTTTARIARVEQRKPGAYLVTRIETRDAEDAPVTATDYGSLYRGVTLEGGAVHEAVAQASPAPAGAALAPLGEVAVGPRLAHVYTECARIWNPIHTDLAHAQRAGLPHLILHGTATLALAVSKTLAALGIDPGMVREIGCRFAGMVPMPATLEVRGCRAGDRLHFEAHCAGAPVLTHAEIGISAESR